MKGASVRVWGLLLACTLSAASAAQVYRVQAGDTLWSLARQHGTTVAALQALNGLQSSTVAIGQVLKLPGSPEAAGVQAVTRAFSPDTGGAVWQRGTAVYYGGRRDTRTRMTAAHLSLPFGTWVRVTHSVTGRSVDVLINDRGPFGSSSRIIDLSREAASVLGILSEGVAPVTLSVLSRP